MPFEQLPTGAIERGESPKLALFRFRYQVSLPQLRVNGLYIGSGDAVQVQGTPRPPVRGYGRLTWGGLFRVTANRPYGKVEPTA